MHSGLTLRGYTMEHIFTALLTTVFVTVAVLTVGVSGLVVIGFASALIVKFL